MFRVRFSALSKDCCDVLLQLVVRRSGAAEKSFNRPRKEDLQGELNGVAASSYLLSIGALELLKSCVVNVVDCMRSSGWGGGLGRLS